MKPITVFVDNLRFVCRWSSGEPYSFKNDTDCSQPFLINTAILKNKRELYKETALKTEKMTGKYLGIDSSRKQGKLLNEKDSAKKKKKKL